MAVLLATRCDLFYRTPVLPPINFHQVRARLPHAPSIGENPAK